MNEPNKQPGHTHEVRIHIDQNAYNSPTPIAADGLYQLGRVATIKLLRVHYIPRHLEPGILYVSDEFGAAVHLCACGCGLKVSTPIGPTDWTIKETGGGPTLHPSVGNWQLPCKSHYLIRDGTIVWDRAWTPEQIEAGRSAKEERERAYFDARARQRENMLQRMWRRIKNFFK